MEKTRLNINQDLMNAVGMMDVVKENEILSGVPQCKVLVTGQDDLAKLTDYPPGTIAYLAGGGAAWQKDVDGEWQAIQNPTIDVIGDAAMTITGHTLVITTPEEA